MSRVFYRKKFSDYLGEQRAIDDIVQFYQPDGGVTPTPTPVPVSPTPTPTLTKTPTSTLTPTPSITPTNTNTPTTTTTPTVTPTNTNTPTPSITPTLTTTPTNTPTLTRTPTPSPVVAWTPASLSNLNDWWSTSFGVVLSGLNVDSWTGYNGKNFTPYNASNKATYSASDSDWNNQPSITINPTNAGGEWGYKAPTNFITPTTISTFIVARNNTLADEKPLLLVINPTTSVRAASLWRTAGGNTLWGYGYDGANIQYSSLGVSDVAPSYMFNEIIYNNSSSQYDWYASNTSTLGSVKQTMTGVVNKLLTEIQIGTYFGILGSINFSVVEVISVNGIVPPGELSQLENYINTTYGI